MSKCAFLRKCKELAGDVDAGRPNISTCIAHRSVFMAVYVPCVWSEISTKFQLTCMFVMSGSSVVTGTTSPDACFHPPGCPVATVWIHCVLGCACTLEMHWTCISANGTRVSRVLWSNDSNIIFLRLRISLLLPLVVDQCPHFGTSGNLMCIYNWTAYSCRSGSPT